MLPPQATEHAAELYSDIPADWLAWQTRGPRLMQVRFHPSVIMMQCFVAPRFIAHSVMRGWQVQ